jgi:polyketide synthase 13
MPNTHTKEEIEEWIVNWLSSELDLAPDKIDPDQAFVDIGVGSRQAVFLSGELEDWLETTIDASLAWDHPTIASLADFLAKQSSDANSPNARPSPDA